MLREKAEVITTQYFVKTSERSKDQSIQSLKGPYRRFRVYITDPFNHWRVSRKLEYCNSAILARVKDRKGIILKRFVDISFV